MNVSLTPELEEFIREKVASGHYSSHSEVVRAGLRLLIQRERVTEARLDDLRDEASERLYERRKRTSRQFVREWLREGQEEGKVQRDLNAPRVERSLEDAGLLDRMIERLRGEPDDEVVAVDTEWGLLLSRVDADVEDFLEDLDAIRREYREALSKLAR